jgi:hypothetical protein
MSESLVATIHGQIKTKLREEVRKLQENELFEQALLRGSQVGLDFQTPTGNIDTIMRSLLHPSGTSGPVPNAGDSMGPSIMTSQTSFYAPDRETDFSQATTSTTDVRHGKNKGKLKA